MAPTPGEDQAEGDAKATTARVPRKLSAERLARKRQLDRQAQHDTRRKTKNYIAHLESIVESLKQPNSSESWIAQIEEKRKLNEQLATTLRSIGRMAEATLRITDSELPPTKTNESDGSNITEDGVSQEQPEEVIDDLLTMNGGPTTAHPGSQNGTPQDSASHVDFLSNLFATLAEERRPRFENQVPKHMPFHRVHHYCDPGWLSTKQLMLQCKAIQKHSIIHEASDGEIPVQAILHGWETVDRIYNLNPLWRVLRQSDEGIFFTCNPSHRLAVLVLMHMTMKYITDPSDENLLVLPDFMRPRPCQKFVEHTLAIDFFPWPVLREHLIFCEHNFCTNTFYRTFHENHNFRWPFEFRDTYVKNQNTGLLELSRTFQEKVYDLQSWTLDPPFFETFPQLRGEIPMSTTVSNPLVPTCSVHRPSVPMSDFISSQIPHAQQDPSSQIARSFHEVGTGIPSTSPLDQTFTTEPAGLFWAGAPH